MFLICSIDAKLIDFGITQHFVLGPPSSMFVQSKLSQPLSGNFAVCLRYIMLNTLTYFHGYELSKVIFKEYELKLLQWHLDDKDIITYRQWQKGIILK